MKIYESEEVLGGMPLVIKTVPKIFLIFATQLILIETQKNWIQQLGV